MSNRNTIRQKQRERFMLECFVKAAKLDAQIIEEREAPDFVVRTNCKLVGVEVTELFISNDSHGSTPQAQEAISSQIATKAEHLYQVAGGPPAHISICFTPGVSLRNLNRDKTAEALCNFVLDLNLSLWQRVDWRPEELDGPLPDEISFIHALGVPSYDMAHWGIARAGWVAPLVPSPVQQRVNEKAKRLPKYQDVISENWLLLVADAMWPSSLIEAKPDFDAQAIVSPFCRTFFYRHPDSFLELGAEK
jgi:hypothetical protein